MSNTNRMLDLLWLVGYCGEFPSELAVRVRGHPEWNRHVKYRALELGYLDLYRAETRRRVIRSLRLTDTGRKNHEGPLSGIRVRDVHEGRCPFSAPG